MPPKKSKPGFVRYSPEIAQRICAGLAEGRKLRAICADEGTPSYGSVFRWLAAHSDFRACYDRAREGRGGTRYSRQLAIAICEELVEGRSLRSICADEGMPSPSNVFLWLERHAEFRSLYARARHLQADLIFDDVLEIADDARGDWVRRRKGSGWMANAENIRRSKLRIAARKWAAAGLKPRKYGDKVALSDSDYAPVVKVVREIVPAKKEPEGAP
jgi:hypothetical protein